MNIGNVTIQGLCGLSPMAGISDVTYRGICNRMGAGLTVTEMVSCEGLYYNPARAADLREIDAGEHPVAIQFFGHKPGQMAEMAARYSAGFDLVDLNMGCPAPKVVRGGSGSALMRTPDLAADIVRQVVRAVPQPVTVKIRAGWADNSRNAVDFALRMQDAEASALCIHGRTREQYYGGQADWDLIGEVCQALDIPVMGNGDVTTPEEAVAMQRHTGCDLVMIGRGAQGNPWIFSRTRAYLQTGRLPPPPTPAERLAMAREHAVLMCRRRGERLAVPALRKHMAWYLKGLREANAARRAINEAVTLEGLLQALDAVEHEATSP